MSPIEQNYEGLLARFSHIAGVVGLVRMAERDGYECVDDLLAVLEEYCVATLADYPRPRVPSCAAHGDVDGGEVAS